MKLAAALVIVLVLVPGLARAADQASQAHVILITIDGFPGYLLNEPQVSVPTLRKLAKAGAVSDTGMHVITIRVTFAIATFLARPATGRPAACPANSGPRRTPAARGNPAAGRARR